jgi:hypothetical protein
MVAMACALKKNRRGALSVEVALITPLLILFVFFILQIAEIMKARWFVENALMAACRAGWVQEGPHPDPEVAAELVMAPLSSSTFSQNPLKDKAFSYVLAIGKTEVDTQKNDENISCHMRYAFELKIPLANRLFKIAAHPLKWIAQKFFYKKPLDLADKWTIITQKPHWLIEKELNMTF